MADFDWGSLGELGIYGTGINYLLNQQSRLGDRYSNVIGDPRSTLPGGNIMNYLQQAGSFTPYTLKSRGYGTVTSGEGGLDFALSPSQQASKELLSSGSRQLFRETMGDRDERVQDYYDRIRAVQLPEEQRQRAALMNNELDRGRSGMMTNLAGGTPQMLALEKARQEAQNTAAFQAMGAAEQEMMNTFSRAQGMMNQSYLPMQQLMSQYGMGLNQQQLNQNQNLNLMNMLSESALGTLGLETTLAGNQAKAITDLLGPLAAAGGGLLSSAGGDDGWLTTIIDEISKRLP